MTRIDVTDKLCPLTWVTAKLALERAAPGETVEVLCAAGSEALENVPRSAREAGHAVRVDGPLVTIVRAP